MFRFWSSDSRGFEQIDQATISTFGEALSPISDTNATATPIASPTRPQKRRQSSLDDDVLGLLDEEVRLSKRPKYDHVPVNALPTPPAMASDHFPCSARMTDDLEPVRDTIQYQFSLEILKKHDELRLVNQELGKCQVALEQLRRCHLIPYPVNVPTPDQVLDICAGKGPALKRAGEEVPRWAPPFGVVDGPYARHYAKWLIPDPMFDGMLPDFRPLHETSRRASVEGRTTRNSCGEGVLTRGRPGRGSVGQKLHSLSTGYPQPKDKAGPCVLKRADGLTVKLVCIDCHRENFSSTQGFINHCRIAHRRDFKSHEEAAVHSGHPITPVEDPGMAKEERPTPALLSSVPTPVPPPPSSSTYGLGLVHPLARRDVTDQQVYLSLRSRINESLTMFRAGKLAGVTRIPTHRAPPQTPAHFVGSSDAPNLSKLVGSANMNIDLGQMIREAKSAMDLDDPSSPYDDSEENDNSTTTTQASTPVAMRIPARGVPSSSLPVPAARPASSKGRASPPPFAHSRVASLPGLADDDVELDADMVANAMASNNAPSLVSDDGEYDDSDDGSSESDASDNLDSQSISDVAEINIEGEGDSPRSPQHHRDGSTVATSSGMRFRKDDQPPVTLMSPVKNAKERRSRKL